LSLINFHRVLISFAILFCGGYGLFELVGFNEDGETISLVISGFFLACAVGLSYYLWHLKRILGVDE
jgi:membrane protein DedA with SNARE-associated domain